MGLNNKKIISQIKDNLKNSVYDYLINPDDAEYSIVHFVKSPEEIDWKKEGWHLWIVEELDDELKMFYPEDGCAFIQNAVGPWGNDHHFLTKEEIEKFIFFFGLGDYEMNNTKNKWYI